MRPIRRLRRSEAAPHIAKATRLVDTTSQGATHAFCVPGESYLAVLDAFHDRPELAVTVCRQEGGIWRR